MQQQQQQQQQIPACMQPDSRRKSDSKIAVYYRKRRELIRKRREEEASRLYKEQQRARTPPSYITHGFNPQGPLPSDQGAQNEFIQEHSNTRSQGQLQAALVPRAAQGLVALDVARQTAVSVLSFGQLPAGAVPAPVAMAPAQPCLRASNVAVSLPSAYMQRSMIGTATTRQPIAGESAQLVAAGLHNALVSSALQQQQAMLLSQLHSSQVALQQQQQRQVALQQHRWQLALQQQQSSQNALPAQCSGAVAQQSAPLVRQQAAFQQALQLLQQRQQQQQQLLLSKHSQQVQLPHSLQQSICGQQLQLSLQVAPAAQDISKPQEWVQQQSHTSGVSLLPDTASVGTNDSTAETTPAAAAAAAGMQAEEDANSKQDSTHTGDAAAAAPAHSHSAAAQRDATAARDPDSHDCQEALKLLQGLYVERQAHHRDALVAELTRVSALPQYPPSLGDEKLCGRCGTLLPGTLTSFVLEPSDDPSQQPAPRLVLCSTCHSVVTEPARDDDLLPRSHHALQRGRQQAVEYRMLEKENIIKLQSIAAALEVGDIPKFEIVWQVKPHKFAAPDWLGASQPALTREDVITVLSGLSGQHLADALQRFLPKARIDTSSKLAQQIIEQIQKQPSTKAMDYLPLGRNYFQCNPDDSGRTAVWDQGDAPGLVALDDSICIALKQGPATPSERFKTVATLAEEYRERLLAAAEQARQAGQNSKAQILSFWAWVLKLKCSSEFGTLLNCSIVNQALLLLGLDSTDTPGHVDVAGALTYAVPVQLDGRQLSTVLDIVLAKWLFLSLRVFTCLRALKLLLCLLVAQRKRRQYQLEYNKCISQRKQQQQQQTTSCSRSSSNKKTLTKRQEEAQHRDDEELQALEASSKVLDMQDTEGSLTKEEEDVLRLLLAKKWRMTGEEMDEAKKWLGDDVVVIEQKGLEGVCVQPGYLHFVVNVNPCLKVAFERLTVDDVVGTMHMQRILRNRMSSLPMDYVHTVHQIVSGLLGLHDVIMKVK